MLLGGRLASQMDLEISEVLRQRSDDVSLERIKRPGNNAFPPWPSVRQTWPASPFCRWQAARAFRGRSRHDIRMCFWKRWRYVGTRCRELIVLGVRRRQAIRHARSRKCPWPMAIEYANQAIPSRMETIRVTRLRRIDMQFERHCVSCVQRLLRESR